MQEAVAKVIFSKVGELSEKRKDENEETCKSFNPLSILPIDENAMSRILAFLLDPNADHGQGNHFLANFFTFFEIGEWNAAARPMRVNIEKSTNDGRRIDVLVQVGDTLIIIENKFRGAVDQPMQCEDYYNWSKTTQTPQEKIHLFYVTREGGEPGNDSISDAVRQELKEHGGLHTASFVKRNGTKSVVEFLGLCRDGQPGKIQDFLNDLIKLIEGEEKKMDEYDEELFTWLSETPERTEVAWELRDKLADFRSYLIKATLSKLREALQGNLSDKWSISEVDDTVFDGGMTIKNRNWEDAYSIKLGHWWPAFNGVYYGVCGLHERLIDEEAALSEKIKSGQAGVGKAMDKGNLWWTWSKIKDTWEDYENLARMCEENRQEVVKVWEDEIMGLLKKLEPIEGQIQELADKLK